jgi:hypothetical protein
MADPDSGHAVSLLPLAAAVIQIHHFQDSTPVFEVGMPLIRKCIRGSAGVRSVGRCRLMVIAVRLLSLACGVILVHRGKAAVVESFRVNLMATLGTDRITRRETA